MHRALLAAAVVLGTLLAAVPVTATVVVPVAEADLVAQSSAIVIGRVSAIESHADGGRIYTNITLAIDETLKGDSVPTLTVRLLGGQVGDHAAWVEGNPEFRRGERVLVFVTAHRDGTARVAHLYQGKFSIVRDASGDDIAVRETPSGVRLPGGGAAPATAPQRLRLLKDSIRAHVNTQAARRGRALTSATAPATARTQANDTFALLGPPSRWFEADAGQPVRMLINGSGEPLAPTSGFSQVRDALAAWSDVAGSSFRYEDGGVTSAVGFRNDGVNAISFRDPLGDIDPPVNCTGTLAYGGYFRSGETRVLNGQSFYRIIEGDVVFADGWNGCGFYETYSNLAEVATHELGHVLGLDHPSDPDATMYAFAHFDGRGASLHASDLAGLRYLYPAAAVTLSVARAGAGTGVVTSTPAGIACGSECTESYAPGTSVTLTAAPDAGSTFGGWSGGGCAGAGTCSVTLAAATSITATFNTSALTVAFAAPAANATVNGTTTVTLNATGGTGYTYRLAVDGATVYSGTGASYAWNTSGLTNAVHTLTATVTDSLGRSATASESVTVANAAAPAPTGALSVAITQPTAGTTVKGTAWAVVWLTGATGTSNTITLTLGGRTVGSATSATAGPISLPYDSTLAADGAQTLTAAARDAGGKTGTGGVAIVVANGTTSPPAPSPAPTPLSAGFAAPAAGATVSGATTVTMSAVGGTAPYTYTLALDGTTLASGASTSYTWNTTTTTNATHTLTLTARDAAGAAASATRIVTVSNSVTSPTPTPAPPPNGTLTVAITQPTSGTTVRGGAWAVVWINGASGGANSVTLTLGGRTVGSTTSASAGPISLPYDSTLSAGGVQMLTASVRDATGNTGTWSVAINVANVATSPAPAPTPAPTPTPAPAPPPAAGSLSVFITQPTNGATVNGTVWPTVWVEGQSGASNTFAISVNGQLVASQVTSSRGLVTVPWVTTGTANGSASLTATVRDANGNTGATTINVSVRN
jgi:Matrixin/Divergent InlB B-repeat domain